MICSFRDIVRLWKSPDDLAHEIGAPVRAVRKWRQPLRNTIPAEWWSAVAATPTARANGVTLELLAEIARSKAAARRRQHAETSAVL